MTRYGTSRHFLLAVGVAALLMVSVGCTPMDTPSSAKHAETSEPPVKWSFTNPDATDSEADQDPPEVALALAPSNPVQLSIPSIAVESELMTTGLRSDGTLEVPPHNRGAPASWYSGSPTPGSVGAGIFLGHVNSTIDSNGVFRRIIELAPGDKVTVSREDGSVAVFEVYRNEAYLKSEFPTRDVYAPVPGAEIRLITCENYIESARSHDQNRGVYARLIATS